MASALAATNPTLFDLAKRTMPDGSIETDIVEWQSQTNAIAKDAVWIEGNLPTGHRMTGRRGLPAPGYKKFNQGTASTKSQTDQWDEACGCIEAWSTVDSSLARLNGNEKAFRLSEDKAQIAGISNEVETGMIYNSTATSPEKWMGFAPRMTSTTGVSGGQIISWGTVTGNDATSMWFVGWGEQTVFCFSPKGLPTGLQVKDWGERPVNDANGLPYAAFQTQYDWYVGLGVKDWRYISRLANIDTSAISATGVDLITAMVLADHQILDKSGVRMAIYCNRKIGTYLHLQAMQKASYQLALSQVAGEYITTWLGAPIRITDAITNTESAIA